MRTRTFVVPALVAFLALPALAQDTYKIDPVHSQIGFKIRHFVAKVSGRFTKAEGQIKVDPKDVSKSSVEVTIDAASVNTDNEARDKHLRSADFFEIEKFPSITFKSTSVKEVAKGKLEVTGNLTIKGVTRQVSFPITNAGTQEPKPGKVVAGFIDGSLKINRGDFNIKYGPGVLGEEVEIELNVEAGKQ
ncbi:MAG: YceI family protein [Acidobacteria bacterium]|nr:YceI family protein [Acidobacteriota bacterium]